MSEMHDPHVIHPNAHLKFKAATADSNFIKHRATDLFRVIVAQGLPENLNDFVRSTCFDPFHRQENRATVSTLPLTSERLDQAFYLFNMLLRSLLLLLLSRLECAHGFTYLSEPAMMWRSATTENTELGVRRGNGLFLTPDEQLLVSTSSDGTVRGFDPISGDQLWTYEPVSLGFPIRCFSGVSFHTDGAVPFMVYAIADGANDLENNPVAESRVIALAMNGLELFQSTPLPGVVAGTPVIDSTGSHIVLAHNQDRLAGFVSILFTRNLQDGVPLEPVFTGIFQDTADDGSIIEKPFSSIGVFYNPAEGYYSGGENNRNDMFLFCWDTPQSASSVGDDDGRMFGIQFPRNYTFDGQGLTFFPLGGKTDFQSPNPPVLSNEGRSYYWAVTKSSHDVLIGVEGLDRFRFDRNRRTSRVGFDRADSPFPLFLAPRAPPTLSSDPVEPTVYGVGANAQIWRMNYNYTEASMVVKPSSDIVSAKVVLTPREDRVIYGSQAYLSPGRLHMLQADTLEEVWSTSAEGGIEGDMAINSLGTVLYVATTTGELRAWQVAWDPDAPVVTQAPDDSSTPFPTVTTSMNLPIPSPSPPAPAGESTPFPTTTASMRQPETATSVPTGSPTDAFTVPPTGSPTDAPTVPPTGSPTDAFTVPPTGSPTDAPTVQPTGSPTASPTQAPTFAPSETATLEPTIAEQPDLPVDSLLTVIELQSDLTNLTTAILSSTVTTLLDGSNVTIFAPTNSAFSKLDPSLVAKLLDENWLPHLDELLLFHMVQGRVVSSEIADGMTIETLLNFFTDLEEKITAGVDNSVDGSTITLSSLAFNESVIIEPDLLASDGVVHKVDTVLVPSTLTSNLYERISQEPGLTTLRSLIMSAGLEEAISTATATLFAPVNDAFDLISQETVTALLSDGDLLNRVLLNHVVEGIWYRERLTDGMQFVSFAGEFLEIMQVGKPDKVLINGESFLSFDAVASNGLFHYVEGVLLPPELLPNSTAVPEPVSTSAPTIVPSSAPTKLPTDSPTADPTVSPMATPTSEPSSKPFAAPSREPSATLTGTPSLSPTILPTKGPSARPSVSVTEPPTTSPTASPTASPTFTPTTVPTRKPSASPTSSPTITPTIKPSATPSVGVTEAPTASPTASPTLSPTLVPAVSPSSMPVPDALTNADLDCSFHPEIELPGVNGLTMKQYFNQVDATITVELVYVGRGWVGIGFSEDGSMVGNTATIGLPEEGSVAPYSLEAKTLARVSLIESSAVTNASIEQTETETTMTFTIPATLDNGTSIQPGEPYRIIYAVGFVNYLSYHTQRGSSLVSFEACDVKMQR